MDQSIATNVKKEVLEEDGCQVHVRKVIALQDRRRYNAVNYAWGVIKVFVLCDYVSGAFRENLKLRSFLWISFLGLLKKKQRKNRSGSVLNITKILPCRHSLTEHRMEFL